MRTSRKGAVLFLSVFVVTFVFGPMAYAEDVWNHNHDPIEDEYQMADLLLARPLSVAAGIVGTGFFLVTLPFTAPTKSTDAAADLFIRRPFKFSFVREFPDENVVLELYPKMEP